MKNLLSAYLRLCLHPRHFRSTADSIMRRVPSYEEIGRLPPASTPRTRAAHGAGLSLRLRSLRLGRLPPELWGAARLSLLMGSRHDDALVPLQAAAFGAAAVGPEQAAAPPNQLPPRCELDLSNPKAIAAALDYRPRLTSAQELLCLAAPALACALLWALTAPPGVRAGYAACIALLYLALASAARAALLERGYVLVQRSERELAGPAARYRRLGRCEVHYTAAAPPPGAGAGGGAAPRAAAHCLHGFGASSFSYSFVAAPLAAALGGPVGSGGCTAPVASVPPLGIGDSAPAPPLQPLPAGDSTRHARVWSHHTPLGIAVLHNGECGHMLAVHAQAQLECGRAHSAVAEPDCPLWPPPGPGLQWGRGA